MVAQDSSQDAIRMKLEGFMENIYRIIAICLGVPPKT